MVSTKKLRPLVPPAFLYVFVSSVDEIRLTIVRSASVASIYAKAKRVWYAVIDSTVIVGCGGEISTPLARIADRTGLR